MNHWGNKGGSNFLITVKNSPVLILRFCLFLHTIPSPCCGVGLLSRGRMRSSGGRSCSVMVGAHSKNPLERTAVIMTYFTNETLSKLEGRLEGNSVGPALSATRKLSPDPIWSAVTWTYSCHRGNEPTTCSRSSLPLRTAQPPQETLIPGSGSVSDEPPSKQAYYFRVRRDPRPTASGWQHGSLLWDAGTSERRLKAGRLLHAPRTRFGPTD